MNSNLNTSSLPPIGKNYRELIQKEALDTYAELLAEEGLYARLIAGFLATDRRARAIEAFSRARELLGKELGVEPGARLQTLAESAGITQAS